VSESQKTAVVFGLANKRSIAWAIAQKLQESGWRLAICYQNERLEQEARDLITDLPGAAGFMCDVSSDEQIAKLFEQLKEKYGILPSQILLGVSTCVDDIIYTKNFHAHPEIKGPFHLGGLAGLPFTGTSGLEAFAHHIPDGGTMLLMIEPHIGISEKGWGYILRPEQQTGSSCCGALMGTLNQLKRGTKQTIMEEDYQGDVPGKVSRPTENPLDDLSRTEIIDSVRRSVLALPERYREVVVLCDLQEMSYAEAAEILGCAVGTVRSRLHRARALLIEKLRPAKEEKAVEVKSARCFA